jgi:hypothetical protein
MGIIVLEQFVNRLEEIEIYKTKAWEILNTQSNPKLKLDAISKLNELTVNLHNHYELLPDYIGLYNTEEDKKKVYNTRRQEPFEIRRGEYSDQAKF